MTAPRRGLSSEPGILRTTERTRLRRKADRASDNAEIVAAILDEAMVCHVGVAIDGRPRVIPTAFGRIGSHLYLHGAVANSMLRALVAGAEACVTVTLIDGLVLARSAFHHSMNYRSVMVFGGGEAVTDPDEKRAALAAIVDHMVPGRSQATRPPNDGELRATLVVRLALDEGSAKVRNGPPVDDPADLDLDHWAGVIPVAMIRGQPEPDAATPTDLSS